MPWEIIIASLGTTGFTTVLVVLLLIFTQNIVERAVAAKTDSFKSELARAEEKYKNVLELGSKIDVHLREQRISVYKELWGITGALPLWPRNTQLSYDDILKMSLSMRSWYFEQGGMWLSTEARKAYGAVQEEITTILSAQPPAGPLSDEHYTALRARCSSLRTELTDDLLSRSPAPERASAMQK